MCLRSSLRRQIPDRSDGVRLDAQGSGLAGAAGDDNPLFQIGAGKGAKDAVALGYVPLPAALVKQVKDYWAKTFKTGA